jgi:hypothetical protein
MPAPAGFSRVIGKARLAISVASNDQGASGYVFTLSAAG